MSTIDLATLLKKEIDSIVTDVIKKSHEELERRIEERVREMAVEVAGKYSFERMQDEIVVRFNIVDEIQRRK